MRTTRVGHGMFSGVVVGVLVGALVACGSSDPECTCAVDNGGERRTLVCGVSACVGGTTITCADQDRLAARGACTAPAPPAPPSPTGSAPEPPLADPSCDDLLLYCGTSCNSPAATAADCRATASTGDPATCSAWRVGAAALCNP